MPGWTTATGYSLPRPQPTGYRLQATGCRRPAYRRPTPACRSRGPGAPRSGNARGRAGGGDRTHTALSGHRILSPARLPVPPPRRHALNGQPQRASGSWSLVQRTRHRAPRTDQEPRTKNREPRCAHPSAARGVDCSSLPYSPMSCMTTCRVLGRVSNSTSTTCCHVPRRSRPSANGTVNDGPSMAALTWLEPLSSPQRR